MRIIIAVSLALACAAASAGEIYKWKDKDGRVHYGDRPKDGQAESVTIDSSSGGDAPSAAPANEGERQAECQKKRAQLERYRKSPSISEVDNLGKTREYTTAERQQFLAITEQKVTELCAPPKEQAEGFPPPEAAEPAIDLPPEEPAEEAPAE
jgi:hypothetical protein